MLDKMFSHNMSLLLSIRVLVTFYQFVILLTCHGL